MQSASSCLTLLLLICLYSFGSSQVSLLDTVTQGGILNSTSQLVSARRNFTLGFYTPDGTNSSYIAIWFTDGLTNPVWIGNRDNPIPNNSSANMTISSTGNLLITHGSVGEDPILLYSSNETRENVSATLLDSGNFVLRQVSATGEVVLWQSFDYPTDTLLPGMKLGVNRRTGRSWSLSSWFGESNPASGPFTLEWDATSNRLIVRRRGVVYWTSGEMRDYYLRSENLWVKEFENIILKPDPWNLNYNFTNFTSSEEEYFMYSLIRVPNMTPDDRMFISGWRLDYQGNIFDHTRPAIALVSLCYGYSTHGSAVHTGCELRGQPQCRNRRQTFEMRSGGFSPVNGRPAPSVYNESSNLSFSDCREYCWNNCECVGFISGSGCIYWIGRNLRFEQNLAGNGLSIYVLTSETSSNRARTLIWIIIAVVTATLLLLCAAALVLMRRSRQRKMEEEMNELLTLEGYTENYEHEKEGAKGHDLRLFTYASIISATSNFSSEYKLGEGGFGPVYKGRTTEGHDIAVKMLSRSSGQGLLEFKTELILISKLQHVNLVKLVGFCLHGDDKMIVYEYMPNKSLDFYLFDPSKREQLDWACRFNIIEGIAQGLLYLHKYSRLSIVHRDLKCSNILLDENLNPKISDFGLARIFKQNTDEANTNRRVGTYGYMAPEYAMQGIFSYKSDVYSFGVLVLEIVSGRKNSSFQRMEGPLNLVEHAWDLWRKDSTLELMDPTLRSSCNTDQFQRCINIGLLCVENHATDRPNIEDVISMLKSEMSSLSLPNNPAFITRSSKLEEPGKSTHKLSANELSVSEITGR